MIRNDRLKNDEIDPVLHMYLIMCATGGIRLVATRSFCVQRPAAAGRAVLGAAARSERVLRGVVRIEEVEVPVC